MTRARVSVPALVLAMVCAGPARADTPTGAPEAIEVDRDDAPVGRPELGFDGGATVGDWAAGVRFGYLEQPIVLHDGSATSHPVDHRETVSLGGALALGDSVVVDATLPLSHQVGSRLVGFGDGAALERWVAGDLRASARVRVGHGVFLRGEVTAPTGDDANFAGAPGWTVAWNLIGRLALPAGVVIAATAGIRLRGTEAMIEDRVVGDELDGAVGVVVPLPPLRPLWCGAEQVLLSAELAAVIGDEVGGMRGPSPVEARVGFVSRPAGGFQVGVRIGAGLDDEIGAPRFRAMAELSWHAGTLAPPPEHDHSRTSDDDDDETAMR